MIPSRKPPTSLSSLSWISEIEHVRFWAKDRNFPRSSSSQRSSWAKAGPAQLSGNEAQDVLWDKFRNAPAWDKLKADKQYEHTVSKIDKFMLHPTDYSDL